MKKANVKLNEYLESLCEIDPDFRKWFRKYWRKWTPPQRKVAVFLDRNLPQGFKNAVIGYKEFKAFEEVISSSRQDEDIFEDCYHKGYLIITLDNDFWNDQRFPLHRCPGVIIIGSNTNSRADDYILTLNRFLTYFDLIGMVRRFPHFMRKTKSKFKISPSGFIHKYIATDGGVDVQEIEY